MSFDDRALRPADGSSSRTTLADEARCPLTRGHVSARSAAILLLLSVPLLACGARAASVVTAQTMGSAPTVPASPSTRPRWVLESVPAQPTYERVDVIGGDRVVRFIQRGGTMRIASARIGEEPGDGIAHDELASSDGLVPRAIATFEREVVYLRTDPHDGSGTHSTLFESHDAGVNWTKGTTFPGTLGVGAAIALGPRGWTYLPALEDYASETTPTPHIRVAGATSFVAARMPDHVSSAQRFVFDVGHGRVAGIGFGEVPGGFAITVVEARLSDAELVSREAFTVRYDSSTLAFDATGRLRAFTYDSNRRAWILSEPEGASRSDRTLSLPDGTMASAGTRALLLANECAYETIDGGRSWSKVPSPVAWSATVGTMLSCTRAGCLGTHGGSRFTRVGWESPAQTDPP